MTETYTYDAFGTLTEIQSLNENGILTETETAFSRFLYAGEQYDNITGLYYLRARRYDTTAGRFTQEDTYLGDGRNLYVYVGNNPLKYVDPSGYAAVDSLDSGADMDPMDDQKSITPSGGGDYNSRGANSGIQSGTTSGVTNGKCSGSKGFSFKGSSGVSTGRSSGLNSKVSISALRGKLRVSPPATVKSVKTTLGNTVFSVKSGSNFRNQALLDSHYIKHGSEFGNISKEQYEENFKDLSPGAAHRSDGRPLCLCHGSLQHLRVRYRRLPHRFSPRLRSRHHHRFHQDGSGGAPERPHGRRGG